MLSTYQQQAKTKLIVTVVALIVIAGVVILADQLKSNQTASDTATTTRSTTNSQSSTSTTDNSSSTDAGSSSSTSSSTYTDGTYTASSSYYVPHGYEDISVTVTLSGDTITDVSIKNSEGDQESAYFQEAFASNYKTYVVGKKISGLQIASVSGASDTTDGFNEALSKIAAEAQA